MVNTPKGGITKIWGETLLLLLLGIDIDIDIKDPPSEQVRRVHSFVFLRKLIKYIALIHALLNDQSCRIPPYFCEKV
jgi:hypothetical protein